MSNIQHNGGWNSDEAKFILDRWRKLPEPLHPRILLEGDAGPYCLLCDSSLQRKWFFFKTDKCVNKHCENYYEKEN